MTTMRALAAVMAASFLAGCGQRFYPDALDTTIDEVVRIRDDADLAPQEKRDQLSALGIDDLTVNAILLNVRLGNQFGGDLRSAFNKVVGGRMATMTPDEIQAYGDATQATTFSDAQAQAIADLFVDSGIDTREELETLLDDENFTVPSDVSADNLRTVFVDFEPNDLIDSLP